MRTRTGTQAAGLLGAALLLAPATVLTVQPPVNAHAMSTGAAVNPLFRRILPRLHRTGVPVLLPGAKVMHTGVAEIDSAGTGQYAISIGYVAGCHGATACDLGSLTGRRRAGTGAPHGQIVQLAHGIRGYFTPSTCGASCDESTLVWDRGAYRYSAGLKAGRRNEVAAIANSAISRGPA